MAESNLGIIIAATDSASPVLRNMTGTLAESQTVVNSFAANTSAGMSSVSKSLIESKLAIREAAMGVSYLGMTFASMGIMLRQSESEMGKSTGTTLLMVGAIMTAVGSSLHFVKALVEIAKALRNVALWEAVVKAFQGPTGWVTLGVGAAVAAGSVAGINAMTKESNKSITVNNHIQGSVITDKQLADTIRRELVKTQQRNNTSGIQ